MDKKNKVSKQDIITLGNALNAMSRIHAGSGMSPEELFEKAKQLADLMPAVEEEAVVVKPKYEKRAAIEKLTSTYTFKGGPNAGKRIADLSDEELIKTSKLTNFPRIAEAAKDELQKRAASVADDIKL